MLMVLCFNRLIYLHKCGILEGMIVPGATLTVMPADTLGRYLVGDMVSYQDMFDDVSPWVRYWLPNHHGRRLSWLLNREKRA